MKFNFWCKKTIRAQEFILEDKEGKERAALRTDGAGNTLLYFRGPEGGIRAFMGVTPDGTPRVTLRFADGKGKIELEANDRLKSAAVMICSPQGKSKAALALAPNGTPAVILFNEDGNVTFVEHAGQPAVEMSWIQSKFDWDSLLKN